MEFFVSFKKKIHINLYIFSIHIYTLIPVTFLAVWRCDFATKSVFVKFAIS